ncbi:hypothetical protein AB0M22_05710 [Nocardia sp. NPDC051756]|uniref:hypothetical protein n=1 Tax=Nocardia sp. NPDC051756 TaxID=3154751 RepID=UPI003442B2E1
MAGRHIRPPGAAIGTGDRKTRKLRGSMSSSAIQAAENTSHRMVFARRLTIPGLGASASSRARERAHEQFRVANERIKTLRSILEKRESAAVTDETIRHYRAQSSHEIRRHAIALVKCSRVLEIGLLLWALVPAAFAASMSFVLRHEASPGFMLLLFLLTFVGYSYGGVAPAYSPRLKVHLRGSHFLQAIFAAAATAAIAFPIFWSGFSVRKLTGIESGRIEFLFLFVLGVGFWVSSALFRTLDMALRSLEKSASATEMPISVNKHLLDACILLRSARPFSSDSKKRELIKMLYTASDNIRRISPENLGVLDAAARAIILGRCHQAAYVIRTYAVWVALPGRVTGTELMIQIESTIGAISLGHYDELPTGDEAPAPSGPIMLKSIARFVGSLLSGLVPLALLLGVQALGVQINGSMLTTGAVIIAVGWLAIVIISALDRDYPTRLKAVQELLAALRDNSKS